LDKYKAKTTVEKLKNYTNDAEIDINYFKEWRNARTLLNDDYFKNMLRDMELTEEQFFYTLQPSTTEDTLYDNEQDGWLKDFFKVMSDYNYDSLNYTIGVYLPVHPFSMYLQKKINATANKCHNIKVGEKVIDAFIENHLAEMFNITGKVIALKLEEYKLKNSKEKAPEFVQFLESTFFSKESFLSFYEEFPVLARVCMVRTQYLIINFSDILMRLNSDYVELQKFLGIDALRFSDITLSTGDSHEQGKAVSILYFDNVKLIYKPKNLQISKVFSDFLDWCTSLGNESLLSLKLPKGIYKESYSYNEFIEFDSCKTLKEVENYYTRYGYLIAICYLLNLNDLHIENIIACGEYPVIIDIETIFQVPVSMEDDSLYIELLRELELESVASSFLLPTNLSIGMDDQVDLSALSGKRVELNQKILAPVGINTENFHYEQTTSYFPGGNNIPTLNEEIEVNYKAYVLNIISGYDEFMSFVKANQTEFIEFLNQFSDKKIRVLLKGTEKYAAMIRYSSHPNYNKEMKYRERLLMNLWAYPYKNKKIVNSEIRDLLFNDIPIFYSSPGSKDLEDSQGNVYKNYLPESGLKKAITRVKNIDHSWGEIQRTILLSSLGLGDKILNQPSTTKPLIFFQQDYDYIKEAIKIAEDLQKCMIESNSQCSMLSIDCSGEKHWKIVPLDESLYSGLSGVAVFFLNMYIATKEPNFLEQYKKIIKTAIIQCKTTVFSSAFTGWLSAIYPLLLEKKYLGSMQDTEFFDYTMEKLANMNSEQIKNMNKLDYINGKAGIIVLLMQATKVSDNPFISMALKKFIEDFKHIIKSPGNTTMNTVGLAHGISGLMVAAASLEGYSDDFIKETLAKEVELLKFDSTSYKWCWGISGMIQARLNIFNSSPECIELTELDELINKFKQLVTHLINDDTLCHGNGSLITTMKMLLKYTGDQQWQQLMETWTANLAMYSLMEDFSISKLQNIVSKGIFDGLCGIGWLYLYTSRVTDNILLLEI
jgi:type 2 lantibiotic biosynthesis protein LanM